MSDILAPHIQNGDAPGPDSIEIMSETLSLTCISILAAALGSKTNGLRLDGITYGRFLVLFLYFVSWSFCATSMVVVSTNNYNPISCTLGILSCDIFYASTKIVIYAWLIERAHLATAVRTTRWSSPIYRFNIALLFPYIGIFVLMLIFRNDFLLEDGTCIIGLQFIASIPLLCYDFLLNLYLTILFVRPLVTANRDSAGERRKETRLYKLTRRTVVAAIVCLIVSLVNVLVLSIAQGYERGAVCLTMCTIDVTINVTTIHWVTSPRVKVSTRTMTAHERSHIHSTLSSPADTDRDNYIDTDAPKHRSNFSREDDESIHSTQVSQSSLIKPLD